MKGSYHRKAEAFMRASRFRVLPIMIIPVILGGLAAYVWEDMFHPFLFIITLIGAWAAHLFSNMVNDLWDFRNQVDIAAKETAATISTNSGFLANGTWSERTFSSLTWALGALIAYFYVAPPIKFGYR